MPNQVAYPIPSPNQVAYPRDAHGRIRALVHPYLDARDFRPLRLGLGLGLGLTLPR